MKRFLSLRRSWLLAALYTPWLIYALSKLKWLWKVVWLFYCRPTLVPEWPQRLIACLLVTFFWIGLATLFFKLLRRVNLQISITALFLGLSGCGYFLLILPLTLKIPIGAHSTAVLLVLPFGLCLFYLLYMARKAGGTGPPDKRTSSPGQTARFLDWGCWIILSLASITLLGAFLWMPLMRGKAIGDEFFFWWSSFHFVGMNGATRYITEFYPSEYSPGYPFLSNIFVSMVPRRWLLYAEPAVPFLYSSLLIVIPLFPAKNRPWSHRYAAMVAITFSLLLVSHLWLYGLCFQWWLGEAMAIAAIASIFLAVDPEATGPLPCLLEFVLLFGIGVVGRLSKPPLEFLLISCVIPCLFLVTWFTAYPKAQAKIVFRRLFFLTLGAVCIKFMWTHALHSVGRTGSYYYILRSEVTHWVLSPALIKMTHHLIHHYAQAWISYVIFVLAALVIDRRRFLPSILASLLLISSIFALFATSWVNGDYESGPRYIVHGAYGWILYFLAVKGWQSIRVYGRVASSLMSRHETPSR